MEAKLDLCYEPENLIIVIDKLRTMYKEKILPYEEAFNFSDFDSPSFNDAFFDTKPIVLFMGQYSVGKTSFIRSLLSRKYPSMKIGPSATTKQFLCITEGETDQIIPGETLCIDPRKPFTGISQLGQAYLRRVKGIECHCKMLQRMSFIDTPGIMSGGKKQINRGYKFAEMMNYFSEISDLILIMFDAQKIDITDEFKATVKRIHPHSNKIRVLLNKADFPKQHLLRIYGALMWGLGSVFPYPEAVRVHLGSFWNKPVENRSSKAILDKDKQDLLDDIYILPKKVIMRKIEEVIKRARRVKVHAHIIAHLSEQFGTLTINKGKMQENLLSNLKHEFRNIQDKYGFDKSDFPKIKRFHKEAKEFNLAKFPQSTSSYDKRLDKIQSLDLSTLFQMIADNAANNNVPGTEKKNPFEAKNETVGDNCGEVGDPFEIHADLDAYPEWLIDSKTEKKYFAEFQQLPNNEGKVLPAVTMPILKKYGLQNSVTNNVWTIADIDQDGRLDREEFAVARFLVDSLKSGRTLPLERIPNRLIPLSKRHLFDFNMIEI